MRGVIFFETLRRSWKQMVYWGLGIGALGIYMFSALPSTPDGYEEYIKVIEDMKPGALRLLGISDATSLMSPEGFLGFAFFGYVLVILGVFAVIAGLNVSAVEEDNGTLDVLLSMPVPRWQIIIEKTLVYCLMAIGILAMAFISLVLGAQSATDRVNIPFEKYLVAVIGLYPGVILMIAVTALIATIMRRRPIATIVASVFVVGSYFLNILAGLTNADITQQLRYLSFFSYFEPTKILSDGFSIVSGGALIVIAVGLIVGAVRMFTNRDIAV